MPKEYVNKNPIKIMNLIETSKLENCMIDIDKQKPIDRKKLSKQAIIIITMLNYQYWCPNKKELYKKYLNLQPQALIEHKEKTILCRIN